MSTMRDICVLVKYSRKQGNILGRMPENFEGNFDPDTDKFSAREKLCPTRWTLRAFVFKRSLTTVC